MPEPPTSNPGADASPPPPPTPPLFPLPFLLRDHTGQPVGSGAILRDISIEQTYEDRLRMFETLVEHAPGAIGVALIGGHITYDNTRKGHAILAAPDLYAAKSG